jgi:RNA polymerase sigma-70 factor (ECF subfamily)
MTRDMAEAEDLAQEALMKAFRAMDTFDTELSPKAWLSMILKNTRIDRLRAASRHAKDISLEREMIDVPDRRTGAVAETRDPAEVLERLSDQTLIDALKKLPEEIRWTILLVDVEQMEQEEASLILDVPVGTVKSRLFRGRRLLREMLLAHGCEDKAKP